MTPKSRVLLLFVLLLVSPGCLRAHFNEQALHPRSTFRIIPPDFGLTAEPFTVETRNARIHGWFLSGASTAEASSETMPRDTVLVFGGNTDNKQLYLPLAVPLVEAGYRVALVDHRGFGQSTGEADLWSLVPDGKAMLAAVRARPDTGRVAVIGISLGAVVALGVVSAAPEGVFAVVLEGLPDPREQLDQMMGSFLGGVAELVLMPSGWEVADHLRDLPVPVLLLHGPEDGITGFGAAAVLFRIATEADAPREFWIAPGAGHAPGIAGLYGPEYVVHVRRFLSRHLRGVGAIPHLRAREVPRVGGGFEIRLTTSDPLPPSPVPVEVAIVDAEGDVEFLRRFFPVREEEPGLTRPLASRFVSASVPGGRITARGSSWERAPGYHRDREHLQALSARMAGELGASSFALGGRRVRFRLAGGRPSASLRAVADEVEQELERMLGAGVDPHLRPSLGYLYLALSGEWARWEEETRAFSTGLRWLELLPDDPFSWWYYDDAAWQLGISAEEIVAALGDLAEVAPDDLERERVTTLAEDFTRRGEERREALRAWLESRD